MNWFNPLAWDWTTLLTVALGSGAGTTVAQAIIIARRERRDRQTRASYFALRLAIDFEGFATDCSQILSDSITVDQSGGGAGSKSWGLPDTPPTYPENEVAWHVLDQRLAEHSLAFAAKVDRWRGYIANTVNVAGFEDAFDDADRARIWLGLHALHLAELLRNRYNLREPENSSQKFLNEQKKLRALIEYP